MEHPPQNKPLRIEERPLHWNRYAICDRSPKGGQSCSSGLLSYLAGPISSLWYNEPPHPAICTVWYGHLRQGAFLVLLLSHQALLQCVMARKNIIIPSPSNRGAPRLNVEASCHCNIHHFVRTNYPFALLFISLLCRRRPTIPAIPDRWHHSLDGNFRKPECGVWWPGHASFHITAHNAEDGLLNGAVAPLSIFREHLLS